MKPERKHVNLFHFLFSPCSPSSSDPRCRTAPPRTSSCSTRRASSWPPWPPSASSAHSCPSTSSSSQRFLLNHVFTCGVAQKSDSLNSFRSHKCQIRQQSKKLGHASSGKKNKFGSFWLFYSGFTDWCRQTSAVQQWLTCFHREMEEPSRSTRRFSTENGLTALVSQKTFLAGNSNGGVFHRQGPKCLGLPEKVLGGKFKWFQVTRPH